MATQQAPTQQAQAEEKKHWFFRTLKTLFASPLSVSLLTLGIVIFLWYNNPKFGTELLLSIGVFGLPIVIGIAALIALTQFIVEKIREKKGMSALTSNWYEWIVKVAKLTFSKSWTTALFIVAIFWVMSKANYSLGFQAVKSLSNFFTDIVVPILKVVGLGAFIFLIGYLFYKMTIGKLVKWLAPPKKKSGGH